MLKVCVVGAGAIGGYLAGKLAAAGHEVCVVARGQHLEAIRARGVALAEGSGEATAFPVRATDRIADIGRQDYLVLALKAHQLADIAADLPAVYGPSTAVVTLQNGIPWWYFEQHGGPLDGQKLVSVDPDGSLARCIPAHRIIGCVVHKAARLRGPGVVEYTDARGDSFPLGELNGEHSERVARLSQALQDAGVCAPVIPDIRAEKWYKLWGNMAFNPICALTHANCEEAHQLEETHQLALALMEEALVVANKLDIRFRATPTERMERIRSIGAIQPSMLQDTEAGRPLEIDAMLGTLIELARLTDTPVPHVQTLHACAKLLTSVIATRRVRIVPQPIASTVS